MKSRKLVILGNVDHLAQW